MRVLNLEEMDKVSGGGGCSRSWGGRRRNKGSGKHSGKNSGKCWGKGSGKDSGKGSSKGYGKGSGKCTPPVVVCPPVDSVDQ